MGNVAVELSSKQTLHDPKPPNGQETELPTSREPRWYHEDWDNRTWRMQNALTFHGYSGQI